MGTTWHFHLFAPRKSFGKIGVRPRSVFTGLFQRTSAKMWFWKFENDAKRTRKKILSNTSNLLPPFGSRKYLETDKKGFLCTNTVPCENGSKVCRIPSLIILILKQLQSDLQRKIRKNIVTGLYFAKNAQVH